MSKYLDNLVEERETLAAALEGFTSKAAQESRDLNDAELAEVTKINTRAAEIDHALEIFGQSQENNARYADLMGRIQKRAAAKTEAAPMESRSWGRSFTESGEFRSYNGRGTSGVIEVPFSLEQRAAITTSDLALPNNVYVPIQEREMFPLLSVVGKETVNSGAVEWIEMSSASAAVEVDEGELKPEASITLTPKTGALKTLAHWKAITRQAAEDAPRLQSIIDGKLRRGVMAAVQAEVAAALVAGVSATASSDTLLNAIRLGMATVEDNNFIPRNVLLNPSDYAALDIDIFGGSVVGNAASQNNFWGLRPISSSAVAAGTAYVGDFEGATVFSRGSVAVYMTDSHADFFIRNQLVILAEVRALAAVTEPSALVKCSVTP